MLRERDAQSGEPLNLQTAQHTPTGLISRESLLRRLRRSSETRARFVESHLDKSIAFQVRALRADKKWTQAVFAGKLGIGSPNNVSARLENPNYGKHSLSTLKKIAASCDVALVVWFIPFSRFLDWVTGTPYKDPGLSESFYRIPTFEEEETQECQEDEMVAHLGSAESQLNRGDTESLGKFLPANDDLGSAMSALRA